MRLATTSDRCVTYFTHASGARLIKRLLPISAALGIFFLSVVLRLLSVTTDRG
ncbi:hypothetical protein MiSe_78770 [Microseira wollei NIES-4236]|uniref:Uncharacterized protein n=1 Tax=Microseira wollei NIES-4236 TaxID=2530354 RepID=A0AAV3XR50_9CYAN|nr:hypothetical protein MiSe_78770 [Microseira wollei NIES-4236]